MTEKSRIDLLEPVGIETSVAKSSEASDVISVSDLDSLFSESPDAKDEIGPVHVGKVVVIEDVAFVTYVTRLSFWHIHQESRLLDSRLCFVICTRTRLSSPHGDPRKDAKPALSRPYLNPTEFPNRHQNLSTDLLTRCLFLL